MSTTTTGTTYWFTEHGEWGTVPVSHVLFGPEHHENIHEAFELAHDYDYPAWGAYLARNPHDATPVRPGIDETCQTCMDLADEFGIM